MQCYFFAIYVIVIFDSCFKVFEHEWKWVLDIKLFRILLCNVIVNSNLGWLLGLGKYQFFFFYLNGVLLFLSYVIDFAFYSVEFGVCRGGGASGVSHCIGLLLHPFWMWRYRRLARGK